MKHSQSLIARRNPAGQRPGIILSRICGGMTMVHVSLIYLTCSPVSAPECVCLPARGGDRPETVTGGDHSPTSGQTRKWSWVSDRRRLAASRSIAAVGFDPQVLIW